MFYSIKELVEQADLDFNGNVAELMIATEYELTGRERDEVLRLMTRNLEVMKASVLLGLDESKSRSGLTGGDAAKLNQYIASGKALSDYTVLTAAKTFLKSSALKFPATLISPVFKRILVLKFPSEYILELF